MNIFKRFNNPMKLASALILGVTLAACGSGGGGPVSGANSVVDLGSATNFAILAKTAITNVPTSIITGDVGASPVSATAIALTCAQMTVPGKIYGVDAGKVDPSCYKGTAPDKTLIDNAIADMATAYTKTAGRVGPDFTELHAGDLSAKILVPGLYKWGNTVVINTDVTLSGSQFDIWIFQIAGDLTQAASTRVNLIGGALAKNVFWQVAGGAGVAIGATAHFEGTILAAKAIVLGSGTTVNGRLFADSAVNLMANSIVRPAL